MNFHRPVLLSALSWFPLASASALIIFGDFPTLRLVTTQDQRPAEFGYQHAVAAAETEVIRDSGEVGQAIGQATGSRSPSAALGPGGLGPPPLRPAIEHDRAAQAARLCNRGLLQLQSGKLSEATSAFEKATLLNPGDARAIMLRGVVEARQGRHAAALEYYNRALGVDPGSVEAYQSRGLALMKLDRLPQAIEDFTKAVTLNPKFEEGYLRRGLAYGKMGEYAKSVSDNTIAISLNPKNPLSYNNRAAAYKALGELHKASADLEKSRKLETGAEESPR